MNQLPKEQKLQFIRIDRGISQFNHDYYAALGLPIITSPIYIRHVYLSIARILHPDVYGFSPEEKAVATQYLAKLVNPAYDILMKEQERQAYQGIFKLLAKRLMQKSRNVPIHSAIACELLFAPNDGLYERSVSAIAKVQYQSLDNILQYTGQISELNLVYILYKEGYIYGVPNMPPVLLPMVQPKNAYFPPAYPTPAVQNPYTNSTYANVRSTYQTYQPTANSQNDDDATVIQTSEEVLSNKEIADRLKICEMYMSQNDWKNALKELREVLQMNKDNSKCLAMLGVVYKNTNQPQMAKISFQRSLQLNPREPLALKHIKDLGNPNPEQKSDPKPKPSTSNQKKALPPPQQRGWLSNLLGWASPNDPK
ncbi:DnaJ domain-containing protein [Pseudanabaena sp. ABRG5-3]|uniref:DnaJ domain-containing protein n=1 Tax=Pseudanabaena sp. ABRG5-3 TaxID=685565 RepID=UPI000DC6E864|nr:DnaJ domain-containing protein [Pseudanabaena sp. ABRG5-3]BBC23296.1 heat shock protein DnaJ domain protein [Pseudanabaena sp. ABRG5-3]